MVSNNKSFFKSKTMRNKSSGEEKIFVDNLKEKVYFSCILSTIFDPLRNAVQDYHGIWNKASIGSMLAWAAIAFTVFYAFFVVCVWREPVKIPVLCTPIFLYFIFIFIGLLYKKISKIKLYVDDQKFLHWPVWKITLFLFACYCCLFLYMGTFVSPDTEWQWEQVQSGTFHDWHPVMHTFSILILQKFLRTYTMTAMGFMLFFCHANAWLYCSLMDYGYKRKWCLTVLLVICLSPVSLSILRVLWKDTAMGISILYLSVFLVHFWHDGGSHLRRWQWGAFAIILVYASFVRHNGFFFTMPLLFLLPLAGTGTVAKCRLAAFSLLAIICLGVYVFLRSSLMAHGMIEPVKAHQKFTESVGVPMCIMSRIMVVHPDKMPSDAHDFMLKICSSDDWMKYYKGDFNSVKFNFKRNVDKAFRGITPPNFFGMFFRTVQASPGSAMNALASISALGLDPFFCDYKGYAQGLFDYGFVACFLTQRPWGWFLFAPGFYVLALIILGTYGLLRQGCRVFLLVVPFVVYTWGTTMLLTGWDHRFFFGILIGAVPMLLVLLGAYRLPASRR